MVALVTRLVAAAAALAALANAQDGVLVHVMSFNVRTSHASGDALSKCSNWNGVRKDNVVAQIKSVAPDFFGTQETSDEQRVFLDAQLAGTYLSLGKSTGSLDGSAPEINSLHYKIADWKPLEDGVFWLGPNPDVPSAGWKMKYLRNAVWGRFQHIKSGQTACIFNTHYETPGNDEAQTQGSLILLAKLDQYCKPDDKIRVVTGDFNALPNYPAMLKLFQNDLTESSSEATFCGNMESPTCQTKFDYTLHRLKNGACWKKSEVLRTSFDGCYTSDHAPLLGTFCFGGSCCGDASTTQAPTNGTSGSLPGGGGRADVAGVGGDSLPGIVKAGGSGKPDSSSSTDGSATIISTKSESSGGATGTVFTVLAVIGATVGIAVFVVRKKKDLDSRIEQTKDSAAAPPSYFNRADSSASAALSPVRTSMPSPGRMSADAPVPLAGRMSADSPVPTLCATKRDTRDFRDSRSSSVSCVDLSPSHRARNSSAASSVFRASSSVYRASSPAMMDSSRSTSNYSSSVVSFDSRMQDSRINFSEAYISESVDSDDGVLTSKSSDFAML